MTTKNFLMVWAACCAAASIKPILAGNFQQAMLLIGCGWIMYHAAKMRHE